MHSQRSCSRDGNDWAAEGVGMVRCDVMVVLKMSCGRAHAQRERERRGPERT